MTICTLEPYTALVAPTLPVVQEVTLGPIAHGGHVVTHVDGRTVFVRHGLPGERVVIDITSSGGKVSRGEVREVLKASPDRVAPPCSWAGTCGGCDFQHVDISAQRRLKAQVLTESLARFGGLDIADLVVNPVPGDVTGIDWRTRMGWSRGRSGWGLRGFRSHEVIPIDQCLIAAREISRPPSESHLGDSAHSALGTDGMAVTTEVGARPERVVQEVAGRVWRLAPDSFWQVHRGAAALLQSRVRELARAQQGDEWWDLYSGAGLFAASLGDCVGEAGSVVAVEESQESQREARRTLHDLPWVRLTRSGVLPWLRARSSASPSGVVLDPPRSGAGQAVVDELARITVPRVVYVACDPVALSRDVASLINHGYGLDHIEAWDLFPMTHHFEVIAVLSRT
jgi:hypothetical protein